MKAKEALELSLERKGHDKLILLIERAAKEGRTECDLEISGCWVSEEMYYELTKEDRIWLIINGYKTEIRQEEGLFTDNDWDNEYIIWDGKS